MRIRRMTAPPDLRAGGPSRPRPGLDRLMRAVATARVTAEEQVHRRLAPLLTPERCAQLDSLLATGLDLGVAPLVWLGDGATTASPDSVEAVVAKLAYLCNLGADRLDLSVVRPERLRQLAAVARRSTPSALRQMTPACALKPPSIGGPGRAGSILPGGTVRGDAALQEQAAARCRSTRVVALPASGR